MATNTIELNEEEQNQRHVVRPLLFVPQLRENGRPDELSSSPFASVTTQLASVLLLCVPCCFLCSLFNRATIALHLLPSHF